MGLWWGFSLPHTLSSLHFLKPHSKCVSEGDCAVLGEEAGVFTSSWLRSRQRVRGINRGGQAEVKLPS